MSQLNREESTIAPSDVAGRIETILNDKNAKDVECIHVEDKTVLADYFVIATARSTTQIKSLADEIEYKLKNEFRLLPHHIEGADSRRWILLDYSDVIVHLFLEEERIYYNLEKLWAARREKQAPEE